MAGLIIPDEILKQIEEEDIGIPEYKVPEEILAKIPNEFWEVFAKELIKIFGSDIFDKEEETGDRYLIYHPSTIGWAKAFMKTCKQFGLIDILEYYDKLEWYDSDAFDDEICKVLEEKYAEKNGGC